jgi:hypothetical protein
MDSLLICFREQGQPELDGHDTPSILDETMMDCGGRIQHRKPVGEVDSHYTQVRNRCQQDPMCCLALTCPVSSYQ